MSQLSAPHDVIPVKCHCRVDFSWQINGPPESPWQGSPCVRERPVETAQSCFFAWNACLKWRWQTRLDCSLAQCFKLMCSVLPVNDFNSRLFQATLSTSSTSPAGHIAICKVMAFDIRVEANGHHWRNRLNTLFFNCVFKFALKSNSMWWISTDNVIYGDHFKSSSTTKTMLHNLSINLFDNTNSC